MREREEQITAAGEELGREYRALSKSQKRQYDVWYRSTYGDYSRRPESIFHQLKVLGQIRDGEIKIPDPELEAEMKYEVATDWEKINGKEGAKIRAEITKELEDSQNPPSEPHSDSLEPPEGHEGEGMRR